MNKHVIIGSRGSKLALFQTGLVQQQLKDSHPGFEFEIKIIKTSGDRDAKTSLVQIGGQGIFVKELEEALLAREIDLAVHSLKDVPTELSKGLVLGAVLKRGEVRDAFISRDGRPLSRLAAGARVGTGSPRRMVQLKAMRADLEMSSLRGNIDTRLAKLESGQYDAIFMASAALIRMGWQGKITEYLPIEHFLPMVGQGAITVELRSDDGETRALVSPLNDEQTWRCVCAERAFLRALGGGCRAPIAALGVIENGTLHLQGMVSSSDGSRMLKAFETGTPADCEKLGENLAKRILSMGAQEFIEEAVGGKG